MGHVAEYEDRRAAGQRLAEALLGYRDRDPLVLALPRGGVVLGELVAEALAVSLEILLVRKIGAPGRPELALGAVVDANPPEAVLNRALIDELGIDKEQIGQLVATRLVDLVERRQVYGDLLRITAPEGRTAILVDDGIATCASMRAGLLSLRRQGAARVVAAAPVASREAMAKLQEEADDVVVLSIPVPFVAVSHHYADFREVTDDDVLTILRRARRREDEGRS